jgi:hypothetical protein
VWRSHTCGADTRTTIDKQRLAVLVCSVNLQAFCIPCLGIASLTCMDPLFPCGPVAFAFISAHCAQALAFDLPGDPKLTAHVTGWGPQCKVPVTGSSYMPNAHHPPPSPFEKRGKKLELWLLPWHAPHVHPGIFVCFITAIAWQLLDVRFCRSTAPVLPFCVAAAQSCLFMHVTCPSIFHLA